MGNDGLVTTTRTRRAVLASAVAAVAASMAGAIRPRPVLGGADDNADMYVGVQYGDVEGTTGLTNFLATQRCSRRRAR